MTLLGADFFPPTLHFYGKLILTNVISNVHRLRVFNPAPFPQISLLKFKLIFWRVLVQRWHCQTFRDGF